MKICLVGNQNSGKTTLFNVLTGMNQKIGNWPGVTIEKKEGIIKRTNYTLVDLPGIYSLSSYSSEEEIASQYILKQNPDIIINIVDATCLERSLYLTTQLLELDIPVIIALNMTDLLLKKGLEINIFKLEKELGAKIFQISALKQTGIEDLINYIKSINNLSKNMNKIYKLNLENAIKQIENEIQNRRNKRFVAVRILERDINFKRFSSPKIEDIIRNIEKSYFVDLEEEIATQRYNYISKVKEKCVKEKKKWISTSEMLDKIFLNKILAIPIFTIIMFSVYFLSVGVVGKYTIDTTNELMNVCSSTILNILKNIGTSEWLQSLVINGIIKGISSVLSFVPQLIILFLCISILETTGYMSRIAFLLDNIFRKFGLSGKALIPFIIGSGCSVPGIMSTKIIENEDERKITSILVPFIPCSAKLPIIALFSGYFFKENSGLVSGSLYFLSIIIIIFSSILMKKFVFLNTTSAFISELPEYKLPNIKYITKDVKEKIFSFIKRAGSTILLSSIVIWFLLSFSTNLEYGVEIENSILAVIGKKISWFFYPMIGVNSWEASVSAIQGLIAKEQVISSMAIISGFKENNVIQNVIFEKGSIFGFFNQVSAYSFVVFNLFSAPCFAAISTMKKELGGIKKMFLAICYQTLVAWCLATLIYHTFSIAFFVKM